VDSGGIHGGIISIDFELKIAKMAHLKSKFLRNEWTVSFDSKCYFLRKGSTSI